MYAEKKVLSWRIEKQIKKGASENLKWPVLETVGFGVGVALTEGLFSTSDLKDKEIPP